MRAIGIDASIRQVDSAQYAAAAGGFRFRPDDRWRSRSAATPTRDELEGCFHSRAATHAGSRNLPGTAEPAVDALIDAVGAPTDREKPDRRDARARPGLARAPGLDSKLVFGESPGRLWDMFGFKEPKPDYGFPVEALWWFDKDKAEAIGKG